MIGREQKGFKRIESIDVIRGLTILVMIFVNDIAGVPGIPAGMKHMPTHSDGMTMADLVFPAFLFIIGMAMPFSIGRRLDKEDNLRATWQHIVVRTLGLLIIGFYMVNSDAISAQSFVNPHLWTLLMYMCVMIIWNQANNTNPLLAKKSLKYVAAAILICLAFLYRGDHQDGIFQMRTHWWGILGLIGWAYLIACLIYVPFRSSRFGILGSMVLLYCFYMADEAGLLLPLSSLRKFIHPGSTLGSHAAIILSGILLGMALYKKNAGPNHRSILKWSFGFSIGLFTGGLLIHALKDIHIMFIISKNLATVPWCLISSALTIWIWMIIYWLIDMRGYRSWTIIIKPAGANPLFAYILAPFIIECFALLADIIGGFNLYSWLGQTFYIGLIRAVLLAFSMTWLAGYLSSRGLQLKL
jgi:heparan-alpha-glucosaminide N-acetyltransferase